MAFSITGDEKSNKMQNKLIMHNLFQICWKVNEGKKWKPYQRE